MDIHPRPINRSRFSGWVCCELGPAATSAIIAYKDQGRTALLGWLARNIAEAYRQANFPSVPSQITLVAAPSSAEAYRKRGYHATELLASAAARGIGARYKRGAIKLFAATSDQRTLGARERAQNLSQSMAAQTNLGQVLIVDDVVTTGATLLEAKRALEAAENQVLGFICFAETPHKSGKAWA